MIDSYNFPFRTYLCSHTGTRQKFNGFACCCVFFLLPTLYDICWVTSQGANKNHPPSKRERVCVYPSCVAHHSCKASREDSTARANVQSFGSLIKLVMQKLQGVSMLGKEGTQRNHCVTTPLAAGPPWPLTVAQSIQPVSHSWSASISEMFHSNQYGCFELSLRNLTEVRSCQDLGVGKNNYKKLNLKNKNSIWDYLTRVQNAKSPTMCGALMVA